MVVAEFAQLKTMERKTEKDIIIETINHYTKEGNPKSVELGSCLYRGPAGSECAFARCVKVLYKDNLIEETNASGNLSELGDYIFKEQYRGFDVNFWDFIQSIHDLMVSNEKFSMSTFVARKEYIKEQLKYSSTNYEEVKQLILENIHPQYIK